MKDFDNWNELKKKINIKETKPEFFPQVGEVWICILGKNIGREQNRCYRSPTNLYYKDR